MQTLPDYKALYEQQLKTVAALQLEAGMPDYKILYEQQLKITAELTYQIVAFKHQIAQLKKMIFGN